MDRERSLGLPRPEPPPDRRLSGRAVRATDAGPCGAIRQVFFRHMPFLGVKERLGAQSLAGLLDVSLILILLLL